MSAGKSFHQASAPPQTGEAELQKAAIIEERAIKKAAMMLSDIYRISYVILDSQLRVIEFNNAAAKIALSVSGKNLLNGEDIRTYVSENIMKDFSNCIELAFRGHTVHKPQMFLSPQGESITVYLHYAPLIGPDGAVEAILLSSDVPPEKRFRNQKQEDALLYKHALDLTSMVEIADRNGVIKFVNENFCRNSGFTQEELIGHDHSALRSGVHPPVFFKNLWNTVMAGMVWSGEVCNKRKDGSLYWLDTYIIPLLDKDGLPVEFLSIRYDITEKKQNEERWKASVDEKSVLLKEIHHRVKNNLNIIISLIELQLNRTQNTQVASALQKTKSRMFALALVHELLYKSDNLSRIDGQSYFSRLLEKLKNSYNSSKVKLVATISESSVSIENCISLGLIINELVSNAFIHAFEGMEAGCEITVRFEPSSEAKACMLTVHDNGVGFDPEEAQKRNTLGLKIVHLLADQIKASLEFSGAWGSLYTISIPCNGQYCKINRTPS